MGGWLRTRSNAIIDSLIGAAAVALVGVVFTQGISGFVAVPLLAVGGGGAVVAVLGRRRRGRVGQAVRVHAEPTDDLRLALSKLLTPHPLVLDDVHHFTRLRQTLRIDGQDGIFELEYEGSTSPRCPRTGSARWWPVTRRWTCAT